MRPLGIAALSLCLVGASLSCTRETFRIHSRTSPKRVERKVDEIGAVQLVGWAELAPSGALRVSVAQQQRLRVERQVKYGSSLTRGMGGSPLWEILEFPLGLVGFWLFWVDTSPSFNRKNAISTWTHLSIFTTFLDPTTRLLQVDFETDYASDIVEFSSELEREPLRMRVPLQQARMAFRFLAPSGQPLEQGEATTDLFGSLAWESWPADAIAIELKRGDEGIVLPLPERPATPMPVEAVPEVVGGEPPAQAESVPHDADAALPAEVEVGVEADAGLPSP